MFDSFAIVGVFRLSSGFSDTQQLRSNDKHVVQPRGRHERNPPYLKKWVPGSDQNMFCADACFNSLKLFPAKIIICSGVFITTICYFLSRFYLLFTHLTTLDPGW